MRFQDLDLRVALSLIEERGGEVLEIRRFPFRRELLRVPKNSRPVDVSGCIRVLGGFLDPREGVLIPYSRASGMDASAEVMLHHVRSIYPKNPDLEEAYRLRAEFLSKLGVEPGLIEEVCLRSTKLWPILSLALSDGVTEVYGVLNQEIYLDHIELGRIAVRNVVLSEREFEKIRTVVECSEEVRFDLASPFAKVDLRFMGRTIRISADGPPSSTGSVSIRNLSAMRELKLDTLIKLGTISREEASLILESLKEGDPVIVAGGTGVGKTTLCNAILAALPRDTRVISVEEVREIEDLNQYGLRHVAYEIRENRERAVINLLHRNPDVVFLGELLDPGDVRAFAVAHESGFKVLATTHGRSRGHLLSKWRSWGLEYALDGVLLVFMTRRKVSEIYKFSKGCWEPCVLAH